MLLRKYQQGDKFKKLELPNSKSISSETTNKAAIAPKQAVQAQREVIYRNTPAYKAKKLKEEKDKKAAQVAFEKERWDKYNKASLTDKIVDRTQAAFVSPLLMASNLISGNQAYIPGMAHALSDPTHPDYGKYLKAVHQEEGTIEPNDFFNGINPFYQGTAIRKKVNNGDYVGAGLDAALTIFGAKTVNPNAGAGTARLLTKAGNNPVMRGYNNIATGNSFIPYAWKSPAVGKTEASTRQLFEKVLNSKEITDAERAVLIDYQQNSRLYTGRADNLDLAKRELINNILKKHSLEEITDNNVFLTRRVKASNKDVFPLEDNKLLLEDRPTSFTVGVGQRGHASASDRIVIPNKYTKALNKNFIKQSYEPVSEETLNLMGKPKNTYETNVQEFAKFIHTNKNLQSEKELIGSGLNLKKIGKVKNDIGGYDYIMKPVVNKKVSVPEPVLIPPVVNELPAPPEVLHLDLTRRPGIDLTRNADRPRKVKAAKFRDETAYGDLTVVKTGKDKDNIKHFIVKRGDNFIEAERNADGTFKFHNKWVNTENPKRGMIEAGRAMKLLDEHLPAHPVIHETVSFSPDSYSNILTLMKDKKKWEYTVVGSVPVNNSAVNSTITHGRMSTEGPTHFFNTMEDAKKVAEEFNALLKRKGYQSELHKAKAIETATGFQVTVPNFKLRRKYYLGGLLYIKNK